MSGYYILHEGLIGVLGDQGLQEYGYKKIDDAKAVEFKVTDAWLGITDKYWAGTLLPNPKAAVQARFSSNLVGTLRTYQTDYLLDPLTVAIGGNATTTTNLFAGAKESATVDAYDKQLGLNKFDRLIDWGWFYFITRPDVLGHRLVLSHRRQLRRRHPAGDGAGQGGLLSAREQVLRIDGQDEGRAAAACRVEGEVSRRQDEATAEMMEIYKKEKINPIAGCLPILIQIPVFFSLYKVLFVTIEMRHAPFFGWIKDLSAPDPTNLFNLFGLLAFDPTQLPVFGHYLHLGIWPIIMGITMWFQMKLNPTPPDPTQKMIFDWMPLIFTFMLAGFPAGLVIYWAWNNTLSVLQQSYIMRKNGAKVELFDNLKAVFAGSKKTT